MKPNFNDIYKQYQLALHSIYGDRLTFEWEKMDNIVNDIEYLEFTSGGRIYLLSVDAIGNNWASYSLYRMVEDGSHAEKCLTYGKFKY